MLLIKSTLLFGKRINPRPEANYNVYFERRQENSPPPPPKKNNRVIPSTIYCRQNATQLEL